MQSPEGVNDAQVSLDDLDWKEIQNHLIGQNARTSMAARQVAAAYFRERRISIGGLDEAGLQQAQEELQGEVEDTSNDPRSMMSRSLSNLCQSFRTPVAFPLTIGGAGTTSSSLSTLSPKNVPSQRARRSFSLNHSAASATGATSSGSRRGVSARRFSLPAIQGIHLNAKSSARAMSSPRKLGMSTAEHRASGHIRPKYHKPLSSLQASLGVLSLSVEETCSKASSSIASGSSRELMGELEVDFPQGGRRSYSSNATRTDDALDGATSDEDDISSESLRSSSSSLNSEDTHDRESLKSSIPRVPWDKFPAPDRRTNSMRKTDSARKLIAGLLIMAPKQESAIHHLLNMQKSSSMDDYQVDE